MPRKTIDVKYVKDFTNGYLSNFGDDMRLARTAAATILEEVLMRTGNYKGFRYLDERDNSHPDFDSTRRFYF